MRALISCVHLMLFVFVWSYVIYYMMKRFAGAVCTLYHAIACSINRNMHHNVKFVTIIYIFINKFIQQLLMISLWCDLTVQSTIFQSCQVDPIKMQSEKRTWLADTCTFEPLPAVPTGHCPASRIIADRYYPNTTS